VSDFAIRYLWLNGLVECMKCHYGNRLQPYYEGVRWLYATALIEGNYHA
jgi:hypothetical protein